MATMSLYVTPVAASGTTGTLYQIDVPSTKGIAELLYKPLRTRQEARAPGGPPYHINYGTQYELTLRFRGLTLGDHYAFINNLDAIDSSLSMGALMHFAQDNTKAGVWPVNDSGATMWTAPDRGDGGLYYTNTEELLNLGGSPAVAVGDDVVVETDQPEGHRSVHRLTSRSTTQLGWSGGIIYKTSMSKAIFYARGFYPALRLSPDSLTEPRLRQTGTVEWEWAATFIGCPGELFDLVTGAGP